MMNTWFDLTGDERLGACATEGCGGQPTKRLEAGGVGSNYCSGCAAKIAALSATPAPDGLEATRWSAIGVGQMAVDPDGRWVSVRDFDQAQSALAAMRAKLDQWDAWAEGMTPSQLDAGMLNLAAKAKENRERAETAEAQVKRLTEEKEALRGVVRRLLRSEYESEEPGLCDCIDNNGQAYQSQYLATAIAEAEALIGAILTQENADGQ